MAAPLQRRYGRLRAQLRSETGTIKTTSPPTKSFRCFSASPIAERRGSGALARSRFRHAGRACARSRPADSWYFPSHGFGLLGGVWPDLTLWFAVALARNGFPSGAVHWLEAIYAVDGSGRRAQHRAGRVRRVVRRRLADQSRHVSLALDRREVSLGRRRDGLRPRRLSHQRPAASLAACPPAGRWTAAVRVRWGGGAAPT